MIESLREGFGHIGFFRFFAAYFQSVRFNSPGKERVMKESPKKTHETHDGKVVSVVSDKLTTTCNEGKQHCHTRAKDAKVSCDGKASKAADLKAGTHVRVTTSKDDKNVATEVESGKHIPAAAHKA
ncbi:hypothetical protein BH10PLA2_BH10PLA2_12290 [soil metagenome]